MTDTVTIETLQDDLTKALDSIKRLEKKNSELIDRERKAKDDADAAQDAADEAAAKAGDVEALKSTHARELKKLQDKLDASDANLSTLLIDNAIATKMAEAGVFPQLSKGFVAMMKADAAVVNGQAMVGDLSLADHMSAFLSSEDGQHYYPAPKNSGGGATGSTAKASSLPTTWNLTKYAELKAENHEAAAAYASAHGKSFT